MNESANRYFIKNTKDGNFVYITTLFDGVGVLKLEGMLNKGKPVNVYSEQWVNTQDEDFMITSSQEGVTKIIHENQDISLTFIVRQTYAENQIDVQTVHDDFVAYLTGSDIWIRSNYVGGKMVHCVCLESYEPTTVSLQRGLKSYIMGTIKLHSLGGAFDYFISGNLVRVALASQEDGLVRGKPYTNYLVYSENNGLVSVTITMGGTDITSTAYNRTTKAINIPQVTGNIVISAESSPKIVFADSTVKSLCVTNWGGNYLQNEITEHEAAQVTSLNGVFRSNTNITSFDELRFFTGLTELYDGTTIGGYAAGSFYGCSNLQSVTIPHAAITAAQGAFRLCNKLESLDLTPITSDELRITRMIQLTTNSGKLKTLRLPGIAYLNTWQNSFTRCTGLTAIHIDGIADVSDISNFVSAFSYCNSLTTITGEIVGISRDISFSYSPLTADSAMVIINGLAQTNTPKKITFSWATYNLLSDDDIAIANAKGWNVETYVQFEDPNLKAFILEQFPDNVGKTTTNEITNLELASITSLGGKLINLAYFDEEQTKPFYTFNELRFFTGITSLYISGNSTASQGEFYNCTNLESIKLPAVSLTNTSGAFRNTKIGVLNLSPLSQTGNMNGTCHNNTYLTKVILPSITFSGISWAYTFRTCSNLTTIEIDGTADFSNVTTFNVPFYGCSQLEHITGTITGINTNLNMVACPLTADSAMVIINGLADLTGKTQKTLTLSSTTKSALTAAGIDYDAIATAKNWAIK